jgi:hypothetical protein
MDLLPQGAWFGLTKSRSYLIAKISTLLLATSLVAYAFALGYLRYDSHRAASLLESLRSIQIGQSEPSVRRVLSPYGDERVARLLGDPSGSRIFQIDPWLGHSGSFQWNWLNRPIEFILLDCSSLHRALRPALLAGPGTVPGG